MGKKTSQKPQFKQKKKPIPVVESDEGEEQMITDGASDVSDELEEYLNENNFMDEMNKIFGTVAVDDWVMVKRLSFFLFRLLKRNPASMSNLPEELVYLHHSIGQIL
ncbi:hypothetical protein JTB14_022469 [Gonioctena quinquepunctata]|nr:hypothetical protein JTB14_022469 [Gonioctena quinquepunctata]